MKSVEKIFFRRKFNNEPFAKRRLSDINISFFKKSNIAIVVVYILLIFLLFGDFLFSEKIYELKALSFMLLGSIFSLATLKKDSLIINNPLYRILHESGSKEADILNGFKYFGVFVIFVGVLMFILIFLSKSGIL